MEAVEDMLANDIAKLMTLVRQEEAAMPSQAVQGGAFDGTMNGPFGHGYGEGASEGIDELEWIVAKDKPTYDEIFYTLSPVNGKVSGAMAKKEMVKSKLPNNVLGKIWKLADVDNDGYLDARSSPSLTTSSRLNWKVTSYLLIFLITLCLLLNEDCKQIGKINLIIEPIFVEVMDGCGEGL